MKITYNIAIIIYILYFVFFAFFIVNKYAKNRKRKKALSHYLDTLCWETITLFICACVYSIKCIHDVYKIQFISFGDMTMFIHTIITIVILSFAFGLTPIGYRSKLYQLFFSLVVYLHAFILLIVSGAEKSTVFFFFWGTLIIKNVSDICVLFIKHIRAKIKHKKPDVLWKKGETFSFILTCLTSIMIFFASITDTFLAFIICLPIGIIPIIANMYPSKK